MTTSRTSIRDAYREHAGHWRVIDASAAPVDRTIECDVAIVGTGAGGGTAAEILAAAGLYVVMIEEGPLRSAGDFRMREADAYPELYQESAARKTADKAINILQGRCVGGGTTVNWTSSFRTPPRTLEYWADELGLPGFGVADLAPWFVRMEARLGVAPWAGIPNANNAALARGARALGIPTAVIPRNVRGCADLGYCGMGCPLDAKQSALVTTIPAALERGATLLVRTRALRLETKGDEVVALHCAPMDARGIEPERGRITVHARAYVLAAGAIGSPALLLRSDLADPHALVGRRTFLHPVLVSAALMPEPVQPYQGAPQSVYSDHFLEGPLDGPIGFKLEVPPVHPVLAAITLPGHGAAHAAWMQEISRMHVLLALLRDGFHRDSPGGRVRLADDGTPVLDYPFNDYLWAGARRAFLAMAELQFAAGALRVMPVHGVGAAFAAWSAARPAIEGFALAPLVTPVVSAHVMGGCPMGADPRTSVVDVTGRHHHARNAYVVDGSLFPTSIGANPQLSIYAVAARLADGLVATLGARRD